MDLGVKDARVIVTGATAGMGLATANVYAREGARLAVLARSRAKLEQVADELRAAGSREVLAVPTDLANADSVQAAFSEIESRWDSCNVLINTVGPGLGLMAVFEELSDDHWTTALELILLSAVRTCRAALPLLRSADWARIVNISAHSVQRQSPTLIAYTAAKAALTSMTKNLSQTLAPEGILVNTVSPGTFMTEQVATFIDELHPEAIDELHPEAPRPRTAEEVGAVLEDVFGDALGYLGRAGHPEEIAPMIALLGSRLNSFTTGADLNVDGGSDFR
ncbi:SDR family NAD(P)-dependent oxidoreductase [Mycolicibacterium anyangense]|nr:SDR family oxidoreductase [Mycolicibacterium anyangense]